MSIFSKKQMNYYCKETVDELSEDIDKYRDVFIEAGITNPVDMAELIILFCNQKQQGIPAMVNQHKLYVSMCRMWSNVKVTPAKFQVVRQPHHYVYRDFCRYDDGNKTEYRSGHTSHSSTYYISSQYSDNKVLKVCDTDIEEAANRFTGLMAHYISRLCQIGITNVIVSVYRLFEFGQQGSISTRVSFFDCDDQVQVNPCSYSFVKECSVFCQSWLSNKVQMYRVDIVKWVRNNLSKLKVDFDCNGNTLKYCYSPCAGEYFSIVPVMLSMDSKVCSEDDVLESVNGYTIGGYTFPKDAIVKFSTTQDRKCVKRGNYGQ